MGARNAWRFLRRLTSSLLVADTDVARPPGRVVLFSCHDVDRSMRSEAGRFSPILEGIREFVEELGFQTVNLSHPYAVFASRRIKGGSITLNYRAMGIRLWALSRRLTGRGDAPSMRLDREVAVYTELLGRVAPELVISIQPPSALCLAAKGLGVRVVEAMHGTNISLSNRIFGAHMNQPDQLLPDALISFDDVSHATVSSYCRGRRPLALKGIDPWLHSLRMRQAAAPLANGTAPSRKSVLVTLQWGYDGERDALSGVIPNGVMHPALQAAIETVGRSGIHVRVRLHPIQMNSPGYRRHRRYVGALARRNSHVEYLRATADPLPLLLDEVCAHLTMSSSSVGEAAVAGVPSLLLCPTLHAGGANHGLFRELEGSGLATFGELDQHAIVRWIEAQVRQERSRPTYDASLKHQSELRFYADMVDWAQAERAPDALHRFQEVT